MGLSLSVGMLADLLVNDEEGAAWLEEYIADLNVVLAHSGLRPHIEPRELEGGSDFSCSMWGYGGLHKLRRVAAHLIPVRTFFGLRPGALPPPTDPSDTEDPLLRKRYARDCPTRGSGFSHLIDHSDADGFYVPQEFPHVLVGPKIPGKLVGSVPMLHRECLVIAKALGISEDMDPESDEVLDALKRQESDAKDWRAYSVETYSCLQLIQACKASMSSGALLVFC